MLDVVIGVVLESAPSEDSTTTSSTGVSTAFSLADQGVEAASSRLCCLQSRDPSFCRFVHNCNRPFNLIFAAATDSIILYLFKSAPSLAPLASKDDEKIVQVVQKLSCAYTANTRIYTRASIIIELSNKSSANVEIRKD